MGKKRNAAIIYFGLISMLIDHIGLLFFPDQLIFRSIGRLAFPIFAWALAQGFRYSSNRRAYFKRLVVFAFISQLPYSFLNPGAIFTLYKLNQLFQFALSFILLNLYEKRKKSKWFYLLAMGLLLLPDLIQYFFPPFSLGYGSYGLMLSLLFYLIRDPFEQILGYVLISIYGSISSGLIYGTSFSVIIQGFAGLDGFIFQWRSILALPLIQISERLPKKRVPKYLFYFFYPVHIAILVIIYKVFY